MTLRAVPSSTDPLTVRKDHGDGRVASRPHSIGPILFRERRYAQLHTRQVDSLAAAEQSAKLDATGYPVDAFFLNGHGNRAIRQHHAITHTKLVDQRRIVADQLVGPGRRFSFHKIEVGTHLAFEWILDKLS